MNSSLGLLSGLTALLMAGIACTSASAPSTSPPADAPASSPGGAGTGGAAAPADSGPAKPKVNRLVMAVDPLPLESNELRLNSSPSVWPFRSVYEYPLAMDITNEKLIPGLATEWKVEEEGKAYRVKLRKGVQFHGGYGELTAADFKHQAEDIASPEALHGQTSYWRSIIDNIEIVNDYEIVYHLKRPDAQFVSALSESQGGAEIRSKKAFDKNGLPANLHSSEPGTGWYEFVDREQAAYLRLKRVEKHWDNIVPDFPEFEFRFIAEPSTRLAGLLTGEVHITSLSEDLLQEALKQKKEVRRSLIPGLRIMGNFNCCNLVDADDPSKGWLAPGSPMLDVRVRQALNKAVNKDELNKSFFGGKGITMYLNAFLPSREGWNPDWEKRYKEMYGFDLEAAKKLLADAGYGPSNPMKATVLVMPVPGIAGGPDIAEAIANYWGKAGVDVTLETIQGADNSARNRACKSEGKVVNNSHLWVRGTGSNQWTGSTVYNGSRFGSGCAGAEHPDLDQAFLDLGKTYDDAARDKLWRKAGDTLYDNFLTMSLFWFPAEAVVDPTVVGEWRFPGAITGTWTHLQNIKAAK